MNSEQCRFLLIFFKVIYLAAVVLGVARGVIYLVAAWELQFPDQGLNLGPLLWEHKVLAAGPPGKFPKMQSFKAEEMITHLCKGLFTLGEIYQDSFPLRVTFFSIMLLIMPIFSVMDLVPLM